MLALYNLPHQQKQQTNNNSRENKMTTKITTDTEKLEAIIFSQKCAMRKINKSIRMLLETYDKEWANNEHEVENQLMSDRDHSLYVGLFNARENIVNAGNYAMSITYQQQEPANTENKITTKITTDTEELEDIIFSQKYAIRKIKKSIRMLLETYNKEWADDEHKVENKLMSDQDSSLYVALFDTRESVMNIEGYATSIIYQ